MTKSLMMNKHRVYVSLSVLLTGSCLVLPACSEQQTDYYWVMAEKCPDSGVRIWFPADLPEHKDCDHKPVSCAFALAIVFNIINDIDQHRVHYHMRSEDRGFVLAEFVADPNNSADERAFGSREKVHYHGCVT
jgi:hypothetical protein